MKSPRYLLLQVRNDDDPMRRHEVECFAAKLECPIENIAVHDLISGAPSPLTLRSCDATLLGGSGDYSVVAGGPWLEPALDFFRELYELGKPTFASCWGFQAFSRALGGDVVTDIARAELGTLPMSLTEAGQADPVFGPLGTPFLAQIGHQDIVDRLPDCAVCLASSSRVANEAFVFPGKPIYGTQFHPELDRQDLVQRVIAYPEYIKQISGLEMEEFVKTLSETPETGALLGRFARLVAS